jgi:hypothetical protein
VRFLRDLLGHLRGKVIVVWDGGSNHKGPLVRDLLARSPRLTLEPLPAYAPDHNPVEMIWGHLEHGLMANFVPRDVRHLDRVVRGHLDGLKGRSAMIRSLWAGSKLPFPRVARPPEVQSSLSASRPSASCDQNDASASAGGSTARTAERNRSASRSPG